MTDKIREAAVECEERIYLSGYENPEVVRDIIARAMSELLAAQSQVWPKCKWCHADLEKFVKESGNCPVCGAIDFFEAAPRESQTPCICSTAFGVGPEMCGAKVHHTVAQPEASSSVRLDGETHCVDEQPASESQTLSTESARHIHEHPTVSRSQTPASEEELAVKLQMFFCCPHQDKYGDDGEMQCHAFDFKRATADECGEHLSSAFRAYVAERTDAATLAEHKSHVEYENELYATLVDPVAEGPIKEAEIRKQLLESARWYRQHVYDLETQLNAVAERVREAQGSEMKDEKQVQLSPEGQAIMDKFATPLYCGYPGSSKWEDEIPIIQRIADRYKECSIHIFEQPEFAVVETVLRCADEAGFSLVRKK